MVFIRRGKYLVIRKKNLVFKFIPDYSMFNMIAKDIAGWIGRTLTGYELVCIQAMLGTNSIKSMRIGPGAKLHYKLV